MPFNFVRLNNRSIINAKDNEIELSKSVQRGVNIIKDNIDKILSNVFIIGITPIGLKNKKSGLLEIEFSVITFKISYKPLFDDESFWSNCFEQNKFHLCMENRDKSIINMQDIKTIKIEVDSNIENNPWNSYTFAHWVLINLTDKIKNNFTK